MREDLAPEQWSAVDVGELLGPDGRRYVRRGTRMNRKQAAELVAGGCLLLVYWPGGLPEKTRMDWFDGTDALTAWNEHSGLVTSDPPRTTKSPMLTAGLWESPDWEPLLVLTWHH